MRIIEADLTVTGSDGSRIKDTYRLITTLTDYRRYPAAALFRLYHEQWEIESAYFALRHTLLHGHVLRSGDRPAWSRRSGPCSPSTSCCAWPWSPPWKPARAPTRTGPASPPPWKPPATSSPRPPASAPTAPPTCPAPSAGPSWTPCCPPGGPATAPASQMHHLPLPRPRRRPPGPPGRHHRDRHHHLHPAPGPEAGQDPPRSQHTPPAASAHPQAAHHGDHEHRPGPGLRAAASSSESATLSPPGCSPAATTTSDSPMTCGSRSTITKPSRSSG